LLGRWIDRPVAEPLILLVGTGRRRLPYDALPDPPRGVLVAFAVPNELRARLSIDIALQIGAHELVLPPATPGAVVEEEVEEPEEAEVIDRAVLAERRARRAELAEEQLSDRARDAEQAAETLEAQLANLEERLEQARDERDELEAQLADAERRLKAAQQREYAEQQQRIEAEDQLERLRRSDDDVVADLRSRLEAATERAEEMARELEQARRTAAEALHRGAADRAAIERGVRAEADEAAAAEREAAQARIAQLEREVAAREEVHTRIVGELGQLREQLHRVSAAPTAEAEERRRAAESELAETRSILTERTAELELARLDLARLEQEAEALRTSAHRHDAAMEEANRTIDAVRASATELQLALDAERRERARAEAVLHEELARARAEGRTEAETVQAELRAALDSERRRFVTEVAAIEHQVTALREQVASATAELRAALDAERAARLSAERQLAAERASHSVDEVERDAVIQQLVTQILGTAASLRDAFEEESRKLESELTAQVAEERARMAGELAAMEARL